MTDNNDDSSVSVDSFQGSAGRALTYAPMEATAVPNIRNNQNIPVSRMTFVVPHNISVK